MKKYTVIIAEDDIWTGKLIKLYCENFELDIVFHTDSGLKLITSCKELKPDLILLDIGLNELDGLAAIEEINKENLFPSVIIISGSQNFNDLLKCVNVVSPVCFLSKPLDYPHFEIAINKAITKLNIGISIANNPIDKHWIRVKQLKSMIPIMEESIVYIEKIDKRNSRINLINSTHLITISSMQDIINKSTMLFNCYKGFIVNLNYITSYEKEVSFLISRRYNLSLLHTSTSIPLSRDKVKELDKLLFNK